MVLCCKEPRILQEVLLEGKHREIWSPQIASLPVLGSEGSGKALQRRKKHWRSTHVRGKSINMILDALS